jgi:biopolymer transport protein ExbD
MKDRPREVIVTVGADGRYMVNKQALQGRSATELASAMGIAVQALGSGKPPVLIISADAQTPHQAVVTVMEAARSRGLSQITFASQSSARAR